MSALRNLVSSCLATLLLSHCAAAQSQQDYDPDWTVVPHSPESPPSYRSQPPSVTVATTEESQPIAYHPTIRIADAPEADPLQTLLRTRSGRRRFQISFRQVPVHDVLRLIAEVGNFNIVVPNEVSQRVVTLDLRNITVEEALRAVLAIAHLQATVLTGNIVQVQDANIHPTG